MFYRVFKKAFQFIPVIFKTINTIDSAKNFNQPFLSAFKSLKPTQGCMSLAPKNSLNAF
ncbi:hypothetical protein HMPREF1433_01473 [Helicobacter pylori GAMchJs117Ai]|nr:hypothetical protein HMPREF1433_01473 [Helicobacter pylori GAMchJs117Ai]